MLRAGRPVRETNPTAHKLYKILLLAPAAAGHQFLWPAKIRLGRGGAVSICVSLYHIRRHIAQFRHFFSASCSVDLVPPVETFSNFSIFDSLGNTKPASRRTIFMPLQPLVIALVSLPRHE